MPEGPSIVILKQEVSHFRGKTVTAVSGNSKTDKERMNGQTVVDFKSWGKHFLICFDAFTVRIHFLLFGSYRINEKKESAERLSLAFDDGEINFYACSVKFLEGNINSHYDWTSDVMSDTWIAANAKRKLQQHQQMQIADALLEQDIFSGVGNIIKNEIVYRTFVHPESVLMALPEDKIDELIDQARVYSFEFLEWKKRYELKKHWLAHRKKTCVRCDLPLINKITGSKKRRSFFCENCQKLYI